MTAWEREQEKQDAAIWKRPQRDFIFDIPYYGVPPTPLVNFDLKYKYE